MTEEKVSAEEKGKIAVQLSSCIVLPTPGLALPEEEKIWIQCLIADRHLGARLLLADKRRVW